MARRKRGIFDFELTDEEVSLLDEDERVEYLEEMEWAKKKAEGFTNRLTKSEYEIKEASPHFSTRDASSYRPDKQKLVGSGSWILLISKPPVSDKLLIQEWGLYWATPCAESKGDGYDSFGQYKVDILVKNSGVDKIEPVGVFPHEYNLVNEELFDALMATNGYLLQKTTEEPMENGLNVELIERGRSLTEDERSIIWSLQVDGLSESKACEEYFLGRHTDKENSHIWYSATEDCVEYMESLFGRLRNIGVFTDENRRRRAEKRA